jgi:hypothetical protein
MAASTGLVLTAGAITVTNRVVFNGQQFDWRVPIATGLAAALFAGAEQVTGPGLPRAVALLAVLTITLGRVDPAVPAPAESALRWFNER